MMTNSSTLRCRQLDMTNNIIGNRPHFYNSMINIALMKQTNAHLPINWSIDYGFTIDGSTQCHDPRMGQANPAYSRYFCCYIIQFRVVMSFRMCIYRFRTFLAGNLIKSSRCTDVGDKGLLHCIRCKFQCNYLYRAHTCLQYHPANAISLNCFCAVAANGSYPSFFLKMNCVCVVEFVRHSWSCIYCVLIW